MSVYIGSPPTEFRPDSGGIVYVYDNTGTWVKRSVAIKPNDNQPLDGFGKSVSLSSDGTKIIAGAPGDDGGFSNAGSAYLFTLDGSSWTQSALIVASDAALGDGFGSGVGLSGDGAVACVGAGLQGATDIGQTYIYDNVYTESIDIAETISGDTLVASDSELLDNLGDLNWFIVQGLTDTTSYQGKTLSVSGGSLSFTAPADIKTKYQYGSCGWWYQIRFTAALSSKVRISNVTFEDEFQPVYNVWDGNQIPAVEVQVEGTTQWEVYGGGAVDIGGLAAGKKIVIATADPIEGLYIDPGAIPNATGTAVTSFKYWNGTSFVTTGNVTDGTSGMQNAGWIFVQRKDQVELSQFGTSKYYAYWYELIFDSALAANMVVSFDYMPYFDINDFGSQGKCCCAWKDRMCYTFDDFGSYVYASQIGFHSILNGSDYGILQAGDGRLNKIVKMDRFHNELIVFQEEIGSDGGCITLFEGYSPTTFGKLVISSKIGAMNAKSVAIVDGVMTSTRTDERLRTLCFFLSRYGVCATDGRTVSVISDDIQNYFDPQDSNSIRFGYEDEMWLAHDTTDNVLRIGLVCGASATKPNVFPVFDIVSNSWSFDVMQQELGCMIEVEPSSGSGFVCQIGGGIDDGYVYLLNSGTNDWKSGGTTVPIDSYIDMEINGAGNILILDEMTIRMKAQAGTLTLKFYKNNVYLNTKTIDMAAALTGDNSRRHRFYLNIRDHHITIRMQNATASESMYLNDIGLGLLEWAGA